MEKGKTIFLDVFRRADTNDDGVVTWEEFVQFFADGVMGKDELKKLFNDIDTHNTNNIDTGELCEYFSKHLGEMKEIYAMVETLNEKISNVLRSTSQSYPTKSRTDQFVTRFLMREVINQISALQQPLDVASDHLDDQARQESDVKPVEPSDVQTKPDIVPGRVVRRARRQVSSNSQGRTPDGPIHPLALASEVDRLAGLLDKLEHGVNFKCFVDEDLNAVEKDQNLLLQRDLKVTQEKKEDFTPAVRQYIEETNSADGALNVSIRYFKDTGHFTIYEVWATENQQEKYKEQKKFEALLKGMLEEPEVERSVTFPASWWKKDF